MTEKEFFEELKKINKKHATPFLRKLGDGTSIGRMRLLNPTKDGLFCPVTAVCYNTSKKYFSPGHAMDAAELMGLSRKFACKVISAADDYDHRGCPSCGTNIILAFLGRLKVRRYRSRMLKILGLEPKILDYG